MPCADAEYWVTIRGTRRMFREAVDAFREWLREQPENAAFSVGAENLLKNMIQAARAVPPESASPRGVIAASFETREPYCFEFLDGLMQAYSVMEIAVGAVVTDSYTGIIERFSHMSYSEERSICPPGRDYLTYDASCGSVSSIQVSFTIPGGEEVYLDIADDIAEAETAVPTIYALKDLPEYQFPWDDKLGRTVDPLVNALRDGVGCILQKPNDNETPPRFLVIPLEESVWDEIEKLEESFGGVYRISELLTLPEADAWGNFSDFPLEFLSAVMRIFYPGRDYRAEYAAEGNRRFFVRDDEGNEYYFGVMIEVFRQEKVFWGLPEWWCE